MRTKHHLPGLLPGLVLVTLGGGLLAREFGLLPPSVRLLDFWPLLVVFAGITSLFRARGVVGLAFAIGFVATGGLLLAGNLGFLPFPAARLWPALLVLLGLAFLFRGRGGPRWSGPGPGAGWAERAGRDWSKHGSYQEAQTSDQDRLSRHYTASGAQLRIESQAWKGGELGVTAGGVELDLRTARLDPEGAVLDLRVMMGGVDIRVPDTWQVFCEVTPMFGGADDTTRSTQGSSDAPRLRITGTVTLGGLTVRN